MIEAAELCDELKAREFTFYASVPCSMFGGVINHVSSAPDLDFIMAANEGAALGVAAGAWLTGRKPVVMLQNSGVGNLLNPLTSLAAPCRIPMLLLISGRGYPDGSWDEPQHRVMGAKLRGLLDELEIRRVDLPPDRPGASAAIAAADAAVRGGHSAALVVPKGSLAAGPAAAPWHCALPLSRDESIDIVFGHVEAHGPGQVAVVSTTGKISRSAFTSHDRRGNFYMQGAMGHARAIALGIAVTDPSRRVVLIDGDGATLMHMGTLSTVGYYSPAALIEVVLDNEAHGSTGNQPTTSATTDLAAVAKSCGYRGSWYCTEESQLRAALDSAFELAGPHLILVKINRGEPAELPRVTSRHSPEEMTGAFRAFLTGDRTAPRSLGEHSSDSEQQSPCA